MSTTKQEAEFTYYGVTKMSYDEQDKAQAAGKVAVSKSPVDISDSAVVAAREAVRDHKNPINWVWFGYEGKTSNKLKVFAQGEDGLKEMVDEAVPNEQLFGLLAFEYKSTEVPKLVYVTWNPTGVPPQLKGIMHGRTWDVGQFLAPYAVQHEAQSEDDLTVDIITKKVNTVVGK